MLFYCEIGHLCRQSVLSGLRGTFAVLLFLLLLLLLLLLPLLLLFGTGIIRWGFVVWAISPRGVRDVGLSGIMRPRELDVIQRNIVIPRRRVRRHQVVAKVSFGGIDHFRG